MPLFIISYDLRKPNYTERDYEELYTALDNMNAKHVQDSVWAANVDNWNSEQIFDHLWQHMHQPKDRLLVARINGYTNRNSITKLSDV